MILNLSDYISGIDNGVVIKVDAFYEILEGGTYYKGYTGNLISNTQIVNYDYTTNKWKVSFNCGNNASSNFMCIVLRYIKTSQLPTATRSLNTSLNTQKVDLSNSNAKTDNLSDTELKAEIDENSVVTEQVKESPT